MTEADRDAELHSYVALIVGEESWHGHAALRCTDGCRTAAV
jgi:hypothetical protein